MSAVATQQSGMATAEPRLSIDALVAEPEAWHPLDRDAASFGEALVDATEGSGPPITLSANSFASAAARADGTIVARGSRFTDWCDDDAHVVFDLPADADHPRVSLIDDRETGRPVAIAAAGQAVARSWPLAPNVAAALASGEATYGLLAFRPDPGRWRTIGRVFGLTGAQTQLVQALTETGDLRSAAHQRGIAYETARKLLAAALARTGAAGQAELIRLTLRLSIGEMPPERPPLALLRDLFGGTERQARLAALIARGDSREEAGTALGISTNRVKADLKAVFANFGVDSAAALARRIGEITALHGLAQACEVSVGLNGSSSELLRFIPRRWAPGRIAVVDHGPRAGQPVLILHSNVTGRHHSAAFITTLQSRGLRPIAFDRAGFGLTDPAPNTPTDNGVRDTIEVMAALDVPRPLVVARCCTASVIASHLSARGLVAGGVMLWPEGPRKAEHRGRDMVDRSRAMFTRFPGLAHRFADYVAAHASDAILERVWRNTSRGYPRDAALFDDPVARRDILRGTKQAVVGLTGLLAEALELGLAPQPAAIDGCDWTLIYGDIEEDGDLSSAIAHWAAHLPAARIVKLGGGGNFLHMTHAQDIADALIASTSHAQTSALPRRAGASRRLYPAYNGLHAE